MSKHSFFSHAGLITLSVCKLILIITAFLSATAYAQSASEADVSVGLVAMQYSVAIDESII